MSEVRTVTTRRGIDAKVRVRGERGNPALVYLHGAGGLFPTEPMLDALAERFEVFAPEWPGFGEEPTEGHLEDMLDFSLHGWDLIDALGLDRPHLAGHSMGGMIAAEMAALNPSGLAGLALVAAAGLWLDAHPVPDIFAMVPFELAEVLFVDPAAGEKVLTAGLDFADDDALKLFLVGNARKLGTAGKILFPIPNRRLSKRLYRVTTPTVLVWGRQDKLFPLVYAERYQELLGATQARLEVVDEAAHMLPYEQPAAAAAAIAGLLG
ncbi:MAG: alpha/beta hydrolase [Acidimicrobiales bacterium]|nr:alpha/beta hydrolase [Acidimicrobiales bacterium]